MTDEPLLSVRNLEKHYPIKSGILSKQVGAARAVDGISFDIAEGETLGLVGESGCGKSTAATSVIRLEEPTGGEVIFNGGGRAGATRDADGTHPNDVTTFDDEELKAFRRGAQMVFQDPSNSFNPRMSAGKAVAELLEVHGLSDPNARRAIVEDLFERVGMSADDYDRYPHEFSGGQKQRIALARALVLNPDLLIADEPVSALDVSVRAEILSLIDDLQEEYGLSMLFISHDMSVVREICDRVAVMYLGEIAEIGPTEEVFANPRHPYTEALLSAIPTPDPRDQREQIELKGTVPSPTDPPSGCRFHTRCHRVIQFDEYDLPQEQWRALLTFRGQVAADVIDIDSVRAAVLADESVSSITDERVKEELRTEFDLPATFDDRTVDVAVSSAVDAIVNHDDETAMEELSQFATPCEETNPEFTDHSDDHRSRCLLNTTTENAPPVSTDD